MSNQERVLELLRDGKPREVWQIGRELGLSPVSARNAVKHLRGKHLIGNYGPESGSAGKYFIHG